jgi:hypothetical protein
MQINHPDSAPDYGTVGGGGVRQSAGTRKSSTLLTGEEDTLNNYRLNYGIGGGDNDALSPRHRHTFDQFRYFLTDGYQLADTVIPAGRIGYFPESVFYGPQVIPPGVTIMDVQFGGAGGNGYPSLAQRRKGMDALRALGGTFESGLYVTVDEKGKRHNQDGFEALMEQITGEKINYVNPRYADQVFVNPENFDWIEDRAFPGVARKSMAVFTERDIRVGAIQLRPGASFSFGTEAAPEIVFVDKGVISFNGEDRPRLTAFGTTATEEPSTLTAAEYTELIYFKLPTF